MTEGIVWLCPKPDYGYLDQHLSSYSNWENSLKTRLRFYLLTLIGHLFRIDSIVFCFIASKFHISLSCQRLPVFSSKRLHERQHYTFKSRAPRITGFLAADTLGPYWPYVRRNNAVRAEVF
jgi:hypothetical protein